MTEREKCPICNEPAVLSECDRCGNHIGDCCFGDHERECDGGALNREGDEDE